MQIATRVINIHRRRGAMAVMMAVCLPAILILAAFAVDVAYMQLVRTELRIATDAAALAGGRQLSISQSAGDAIAAAQDAATKNNVAGEPFQLNASDVTLGSSARPIPTARWQFTPGVGGGNINSVQVLGNRTPGSAAGAATLFFGGVWGQGSFAPVKSAVSIQIDRDIALILDRSGSMAWRADGAELDWVEGEKLHPHARWINLETAVNSFLDILDGTLPTESVALATYSTEATLDLELSASYQPVRDRLDFITNNYNGSMTAIGIGMETGMPALLNVMTARPNAKKTIVLMTDGEHNTGIDPDVVATNLMAAHDLVIHTVTFGDTADQVLMQQVATIGGGQHWHAADGADLTAAFNAIANDVPTLLID